MIRRIWFSLHQNSQIPLIIADQRADLAARWVPVWQGFSWSKFMDTSKARAQQQRRPPLSSLWDLDRHEEGGVQRRKQSAGMAPGSSSAPATPDGQLTLALALVAPVPRPLAFPTRPRCHEDAWP